MYWPMFFPVAQAKSECTAPKESASEPTVMPNGTDGYICLGCHVFCAYVKANCKNGYRCPDCR